MASAKDTLIAILVLALALVSFVAIKNKNHNKNDDSCFVEERSQNPLTAPDSVKDVHLARKPVAWVQGQNMHHGYLGHIIKVFKQIGYHVHNDFTRPENWDVLWVHEYPFSQSFQLGELLPHQKVNHFPGSGFITNKVNLATSGLKGVPIAFNLPKEKEKFLEHAKANPDKLWVQKDNNHRGIEIKNLDTLELEKSGSFVQEFIQNPLLIDGKKFDLGLYVTMTSVNPLRVYVYDNDALLRFCYQPYEPFNSTNLDSYVVGDKYTPAWEESLAKYFIGQNMNFKEAFNAYIRYDLKKDPEEMWAKIEESIRTIYYMKEAQIAQFTQNYPQRHFFEMVRFDFTIDSDLNIYLMEANMSPNLASAKYPPNRILYEPVLYSLFSLTGLTKTSTTPDWKTMSGDDWDMYLLDKDLAVFPEHCAEPQCLNSTDIAACESEECDLCSRCIPADIKLNLKDAYIEEHSRWHNKRLIPSTSIQSPVATGQANYFQDKWFIGKCYQDRRWCN